MFCGTPKRARKRNNKRGAGVALQTVLEFQFQSFWWVWKRGICLRINILSKMFPLKWVLPFRVLMINGTRPQFVWSCFWYHITFDYNLYLRLLNLMSVLWLTVTKSIYTCTILAISFVSFHTATNVRSFSVGAQGVSITVILVIVRTFINVYSEF